MKTITIPETITLKNPDGSSVKDSKDQLVTVSFKDFLANTVLIDTKFGKTMNDILSAVALRERLCGAGTGIWSN